MSYHQEWYEKNREKLLEYRREWYAKNPEKQLAYNRKWMDRKIREQGKNFLGDEENQENKKTP